MKAGKLEKVRKSAGTKSVRFTEKQLAYIEGLPGATFTEKLSSLIDDAIDGGERRREELAYYNSMLERRVRELKAYSCLSSSLSGIRKDVLRLEYLAHDLLGRMETAALLLPEAGQERPP